MEGGDWQQAEGVEMTTEPMMGSSAAATMKSDLEPDAIGEQGG